MDAKKERDNDLVEWSKTIPRIVSLQEMAAFKKGWAMGGISVVKKLEKREQRETCCCGHCNK